MSPVREGATNMSNSIAWDDPSVKVIVGVDTHKHEHVAVAINDLGARLATFRAPANRAGYADLVAWARTLGAVEAFGTEGTGSYGAGLASFVRREGLRVVEVNHCDRRKRRNNGKDDTLDAESAARSVLSGIATAIPKSADGTAEMVRQIKIARDTAIKARSAAIVTLKTLLVNAPGALREALEPLTDRKLIERCAALRPGEIIDPTASVKHSLRALAARWRTLAAEIGDHGPVSSGWTVFRPAAGEPVVDRLQHRSSSSRRRKPSAHERTEHHVPPGTVDLPGLWTPAHRRAESGGRRGGRPQAVGNLAGERRRPCLHTGREIPTVPQRIIIIIDNRVRTGLVPTVAAAGQCRSRGRRGRDFAIGIHLNQALELSKPPGPRQ